MSNIDFEKYEKQTAEDLDCYFSDDVFFEICIGDRLIVSTENPSSKDDR